MAHAAGARFVISHVYSKDNKGDAAILAAQIQELRRIVPDAVIDVFSIDDLAPGETFDGCDVHNALMFASIRGPGSRGGSLVRSLAMIGYTLVWAVTKRLSGRSLPLPKAWQRPLTLMAAADAQVCVGGGYLRGTPGVRSTFMLWLLLHQILVARALGLPTYLYAQSFGPFSGRLQAQAFAFVAKRVQLVLPREEISAALLVELGVAGPQVARVADSAFLLKPDVAFDCRSLFADAGAEQPVVGLTVREWLEPAAQARYETAIVELVRHVLDRGWNLLVVPQVTSEHHGDDDRVAGRRIAAAVGPNGRFIALEDNLDHHHIKSLYSTLDFLVGTRFHSVIFALASCVPAMAIEYEHKTSGILRDLELSRWYLPMAETTGPLLIAMFDELVENADGFVRDIRSRLPAYLELAAKGADLIKLDLQGRGILTAAEGSVVGIDLTTELDRSVSHG